MNNIKEINVKNVEDGYKYSHTMKSGLIVSATEPLSALEVIRTVVRQIEEWEEENKSKEVIGELIYETLLPNEIYIIEKNKDDSLLVASNRDGKIKLEIVKLNEEDV